MERKRKGELYCIVLYYYWFSGGAHAVTAGGWFCSKVKVGVQKHCPYMLSAGRSSKIHTDRGF